MAFRSSGYIHGECKLPIPTQFLLLLLLCQPLFIPSWTYRPLRMFFNTSCLVRFASSATLWYRQAIVPESCLLVPLDLHIVIFMVHLYLPCLPMWPTLCHLNFAMRSMTSVTLVRLLMFSLRILYLSEVSIMALSIALCVVLNWLTFSVCCYWKCVTRTILL